MATPPAVAAIWPISPGPLAPACGGAVAPACGAATLDGGGDEVLIDRTGALGLGEALRRRGIVLDCRARTGL